MWKRCQRARLAEWTAKRPAMVARQGRGHFRAARPCHCHRPPDGKRAAADPSERERGAKAEYVGSAVRLLFDRELGKPLGHPASRRPDLYRHTRKHEKDESG